MTYDRNSNQESDLGGFDLKEIIEENSNPGVNVGDPPEDAHLSPATRKRLRELREQEQSSGIPEPVSGSK